ncbi:MAG: histidine--tRNA ligase [Oscillospiraceae bacterium]|jgi:histidyl-tRNA synthetase|nr:histidine--tRNA ligase [Oscillospiraceae bacterium]
MNLISKRIRGMQDILPGESEKWEYVENVLKKKSKLFGFKIIRTPVLEHTNLFERTSGETSDIVKKEMYTFLDKGERSVSLRPEGTAGVLRAVLENGLHDGNLPLKLMYVSSCYRYEKPQSGRYREFFQFGLEIFGGKSALADAEVICVAKSIFNDLGIKNLELEINAVGCKECKSAYNKALENYFIVHKENLCELCGDRLERNPMRIFDCKNDKCKNICKNAPTVLEYLCAQCALHLEHLKEYLEVFNIKYRVNPHIVRGLDYYTKTVFEFIINSGEAPLTVCGGGRYDNLSKELGGADMCAVGFGIGLERLLLIMQDQKLSFGGNSNIHVYVIPLGETCKNKSIEISQRLRNIGIATEQDIVGRNLKSQMKYANKIKCDYCIFCGNQEIENNTVKIKNMSAGNEFTLNLDEDFEKYFLNLTNSKLQ